MNKSVKIERERYIGGSDIPVILGISPFKRRFDLLLEKAQISTGTFEGNVYTDYGNELEPKIRDFINKQYVKDFKEDSFEFPSEDEVIGIRCNVDGIDTDTVLEIKTTSMLHDKVEEYEIYLVQLLFYMQYTKRDKGLLAIYERPEDFDTEFDPFRLSLYPIEIEDYKELLDKINAEVIKFKKDLEKVKANPFITEEELIPKDIVVLSNQVVALEEKLSSFKEIKEQYEMMKESLLKLMEEKGVDQWKTPNNVLITKVNGISDKEVEETSFDETQFKEEHQDLYNKYLKKNKIIKKGRKGYLRITLPKEE